MCAVVDPAVRLRLLELWIAELYARLRTAEARAQTAQSTIERQVATATAQYLATQIERHQDACYAATAPHS